MEKLASASMTRAERKMLIDLLKKIGYEAAGAKKNRAGAFLRARPLPPNPGAPTEGRPYKQIIKERKC
jgi:hypothetical protein